MNEHQLYNQQLDLENKDILEEMKAGNWRYDLNRMYRCVVCGRNFVLTKPNMEFYDWDFSRYQCYDCQGKE